MYHKGSEPELRRALQRGVRKVTDGLAELRVEMIEPAKWKGFDSDGLLFKNVNTPADYEAAEAKFAGRAEK
jgi:molybdopterin-guanine dinucleotide biosynthesis protein A